MEDTPPKQMRARSGEHDIVYYRLDEMGSDIRDLTKELRAFMEHVREQESDAIRAIERCGLHDRQLKDLHDQIIPAIHQRIDAMKSDASRDPITFWTAMGAAATAVGIIVHNIFGGKP